MPARSSTRLAITPVLWTVRKWHTVRMASRRAMDSASAEEATIGIRRSRSVCLRRAAASLD